VYAVALRLPPNALGSYFSLAHPDLRVEIINRMVVGRDLMLAEARISTPGPVDLAEWTEELRRFPGVEQVDLQVEGPGRVLSRVVLSRGLVERVVQKHRVLARYPLVIQGGWLRFETLATRSQMRPFLREVEQRVGPSQVESIRRHAVSLGSLGLTASQDAVFRAALRTGYFSVPRRISVSGLAAQLGRSKSSTSEMLSKIHQRLAESALQLDLAPVVSKE
jgi:predicted DNA binding protein